MGMDPITGTLASGAYQTIQSLAAAAGPGTDGYVDGIDLENPDADAQTGETLAQGNLGDFVRNVQGVFGNLTPEEQVQYQEIVTGQNIYRDPIMSMQQPDAPATLADDRLNQGGIDDILGDVDLNNPDNVVDSSMPSNLGDTGGNMDNMTGATRDLVDPNVNIDEFAMPTDPIMDSNLMGIRQQQNLELNQSL